MRLIDAEELISHLKKDPLYPLIDRYGIENVIESRPTVKAIPLEVLEQIRAEIIAMRSNQNCSCSDCLDIIDKYRQEG